jgi:hypothetical protein
VTAIGADGMYYIMHNTQAGTIPVFTVESVLVVGGRVAITVIAKVAWPVTLAVGVTIGAGVLAYHYWDELAEAIESGIVQRIADSLCPKGDAFYNYKDPPFPGLELGDNSAGNLFWRLGNFANLFPDLFHKAPIGPHWDL